MNTFEVERFHHYDGVHNLDSQINPGDVVNVIKDMVGIDVNGNTYTLKTGSFFTPNVVMISSIGNDMVTLNDGTPNSPIVIVHPPDDGFEPANFINEKLFSPYVTATNVVHNVVTGVENAATTTGNLINGIGSHLSWIILAAVLIGGLLLWSNLKKVLS